MDATQATEQATPGIAHGYMKAQDKEKVQNRLRRIEGQVPGYVG